ncbi:MAG: universal stress protein [Gemmatimonadaceae bacterium]|nr:universal stress protein [Gemmatimonadaceae bacterium]
MKGDVLHLVHVVGVWHGGFPIEQRITTESMLAAIAHQLDAPVGASIEQSVIEGDPADQLLQLAATSKSDVIVLGSHGYGFWKRLTIGSVASKVIRLSTAAVFVTPIGSLGAIAPVSAAAASGMAGA